MTDSAPGSIPTDDERLEWQRRDIGQQRRLRSTVDEVLGVGEPGWLSGDLVHGCAGDRHGRGMFRRLRRAMLTSSPIPPSSAILPSDKAKPFDSATVM